MKKLKTVIILCITLLIYNNSKAQCVSGNCEDLDIVVEPNPSFDPNLDWPNENYFSQAQSLITSEPITDPNIHYSGSGTYFIDDTGAISIYNVINSGYISSAYNFIQGREYCITYTVTSVIHPNISNIDASPAPSFGIQAGNEIIGETMLSEIHSSGTKPFPPETRTYTYTFSPTDNHNYLSVFKKGFTTSYLKLENLRVCDLSETTYCNTKFNLGLDEHSSGKTIINLQMIDQPHDSSINLNIIKDGTIVHSGESLVSYLATPGSYKICITTTLIDGTTCSKCFSFCVEQWDTGRRRSRKSTTEYESSINNGPENTIKIYPNPNNGIFTIDFKDDKTIKNIDVYDILSGQLIKTIKSEKKQINVDLSKHKIGIYNLRIQIKDKDIINKKVVIQ
ncbi:T9SS type A sorting domain-containing protein [uncultured Lacinutrix sp.]|uniref:T9SS type A sorting domain-containing protein n=1 Tax=uncultured Lacinutrix sp. TaxID=574032 RepID=UPI0026076CC5|nr:T9SS type A sorting domain-containing protein [uncultured Lacinutrix sp.]